MPATRRPPHAWSRAERAALGRLSTPRRIQDLLDLFAYRTEDAPASPRRALRERRAHCLDGALLAAAALRFHGHRPLLLDLRAVHDDDHVLAVYRRAGGWGAVAKSNFAGLRYREPVHRSLRELAMTYFDPYFNLERERTLRSYSTLLPLDRLDGWRWEWSDEAVPRIVERLDALRHFPLVDAGEARRLRRVDRRTFRAGTLGLRSPHADRRG
jgi:hypothetical protein